MTIPNRTPEPCTVTQPGPDETWDPDPPSRDVVDPPPSHPTTRRHPSASPHASRFTYPSLTSRRPVVGRPSLTSVSLARNMVGADGGVALAAAILEQRAAGGALLKLDLQSAGVPPEAVGALQSAAAGSALRLLV